MLEGPLGLFRSHVQADGYAFGFDRMNRDLGSVWEMREIEIKPYPCGHVSQPFVDCAVSLARQGLKAHEIERVTCLVADWMVPVVCEPIERKRRPATPWHGRVSLPYTIAETLLFGKLDASSYRPENILSPELLDLVDRVGYEVDPAPPAGSAYKGWIRVHTRDGRVLDQQKHDASHAGRHMSEEAFQEKIRGCLAIGGLGGREALIAQAVAELRDARSVAELMRRCDPGYKPH